MVNTKCYLIFAVTFLKAKKTSSFCFCWLLSANCECVKRPCLPGMEKNLLRLEITNYCSSWRRVMAFERDRGFFCWRILPASFSDFVERGNLLTSLTAYLSTTKLTQTWLRTFWIPLHKVLLQGKGDVNETRKLSQRGHIWGDLKDYNLTGYWRERD